MGLVDRGDLRLIGRASRQISRQAPRRQHPDLFAVLQALCAGRYTAEQLARVIPEEVVMASTIYEKVRARAHEKGLEEGLAKGLEEGLEKGFEKGLDKELADARRLCASFVKRYHAPVASRVLPGIEACTDVARLHRWVLLAPEVSSDEFVRLVKKSPAARVTRRRVPRPARRAGRSTDRSRS